MIDHVSLGTLHYEQAVAFYAQVLAPMGLALQRDTGREAAFGTADRWSFFLYPGEPGRSVIGQGTHVAFGAGSRAAVTAVHAAALAAAAADIFTPRPRPDISPTYFGAMFKDLDGHKVEILTNAA